MHTLRARHETRETALCTYVRARASLDKFVAVFLVFANGKNI